jgi:MFS family permease
VFDGLRIIARTPVLRVLVLLNLALAVVLASTQGMVIPVHFAFLDQAQYVGFVLSALAAGLLVGGALFSLLGDRIPRRAWFVVGVLVVAVGFVVIGILGPVWSIFTGAAIVGLGGGCMNAVVGLTFVEQIEDAHRGKVLGAQNAVVTLVPAAGIGGASLLIELGGLHVTTAVLAGLWIVAGLACLLTPSLPRLGAGNS